MPKRDNVEAVRIRRIENGYIVSRETYSPQNGFECREIFTDKRPDLSIAGLKPKTGGAPKGASFNSLSTAMRELSKK
jgi:hypothetical protein